MVDNRVMEFMKELENRISTRVPKDLTWEHIAPQWDTGWTATSFSRKPSKHISFAKRICFKQASYCKASCGDNFKFASAGCRTERSDHFRGLVEVFNQAKFGEENGKPNEVMSFLSIEVDFFPQNYLDIDKSR